MKEERREWEWEGEEEDGVGWLRVGILVMWVPLAYHTELSLVLEFFLYF